MADFDIEASRATEPYFYHAPTPPGTEPKPYQYAGAEYALARPNSLIADAPGLGKTAESILVGNAEEANRSLVICPASLRLNWEREIWTWSTISNVTTYPILKSRDGVSHEHNYVIISYALLSNPAILQSILDQRWDHVILDEAHAIKDPKKNNRTSILTDPNLIPSVAGRITMLTGTPMPNGPIEIYNAMRLLDWDSIDRVSLQGFQNSYYDFGEGWITRRKWDDIAGKFVFKKEWSDKVRNVPVNLPDLQERLRKNIMVRRLKPQVLKQLPPIQWHMFPLALTPDMRRVMKHPGWKMCEHLYEQNEDTFDTGVPIDGEISTARRLLGEAKAPGVLEFILELHASGADKIVVGAWHHTVLDFLREKLEKYGLVYMDGNTSAKKKQLIVDKFQEDDDIVFILGQTIVIGEGWTLTRAQDVVNAEPDWVPGKNDQLVERINRLGQLGTYTIGHLPVVPGTMDERILGRAIGKAKHIHKALDA